MRTIRHSFILMALLFALPVVLSAQASITGVNPAIGPSAGGQAVTITGSGFTASTAVEFDGVAGTGLNVVNDNQIDVTTPAGTAGQVDVVVFNPGGDDTEVNGYEYVDSATVSNVSPNAGPLAGGTTVTLTGTNFVNVTQVTFDGTPGTNLNVASATSLTVDTPAHAAAQVDVIVEAVGGNGTSVNGYRYAAAATITVVNPSAGPLAGGTAVTLTGTNFFNVTQVTFDGTPGTNLNVASATSLTVDTPAHAAAQVDVVVSAAGGNGTSVNGFRYAAAATISNVNPNNGTTAGGTTVTLTGTNYFNVTQVTFDGTPGTNLNVASDTSLTVDTPAHAAGQVDVVVVAAGGNGTAVNGYDYQTPANPSPIITVNAGGGAVTSGGTVNVINASTVAALNVQIAVNDASTGDSVTLVAMISNLGTTGIVTSQWEGAATSPTPINANPATGTFNANVTHAVTLTASDAVNGDVVFTFNIVVSAAPTITVNGPNGGENFTVGGNMTVTWSHAGVTGNVDILLSTTGGAPFSITLAAGTANDLSQIIVVPNNPSTTCRVRIQDTNTGAIFDDSNATFTIAVPAPAAVAMSAAGNPGSSNVSPGSTRTALGFRLSESGGASSFTVTSVTVRVTTFNNTGGVAINAMTAITLRRGGTVLGTITSATWIVAGDVVTANFTGLSSVITAGAAADFTVSLSFSGAAVPSPNPRYQAAITTADVNGGASVTGANVTGGTLTLVEQLPDDPLDEEPTDDSCELAAQGGPAWPMLAVVSVLVMMALIRRRKSEVKE